jgi:hypothetical protein
MTTTPRWQRAVIGAERTTAPVLRTIVTGEDFAIAVGLVRTVGRVVNRATRRWSAGVLHLCNLPAATDIQALQAAVASLEREVANADPR